MNFYDRVYTTAKKRGLSIKKLADKIGISDATIYTWKRTGAPTGKNLNATAEALGVSVEYLLGNTDNPTINNNDNEPNDIDLKEYAEKRGLLKFNGHPIDEEDLRIIYRILETGEE